MVALAPRKRVFRNVFKPKTCPVYKPRKNTKKQLAPPHQLRTPRQRRMEAGRAQTVRRYRPGSIFLSNDALTIARALREIRYYQSKATANTLLLPFTSFSRLVREIAEDYGRHLLWERDALVALQMMTEHIMVMIFEMTYHPSYLFDGRQKLAIHAKRITISDKDMRILRDLWGTIDPTSTIGKAT